MSGVPKFDRKNWLIMLFANTWAPKLLQRSNVWSYAVDDFVEVKRIGKHDLKEACIEDQLIAAPYLIKLSTCQTVL